MQARKKDKAPEWVYFKIAELLTKILEKEGRNVPS